MDLEFCEIAASKIYSSVPSFLADRLILSSYRGWRLQILIWRY